jgi:hypothetical protein
LVRGWKYWEIQAGQECDSNWDYRSPGRPHSAVEPFELPVALIWNQEWPD